MADAVPKLRNATRDDLVALHALVERAYRGDAARKGWTHEADLLRGQRTDVGALKEMLDDPRQRVIVAATDAALLGCVGIAARPGAIGHLGMLSVDPAHQASGLGSRLIAAAEATAASDFGATAVEMTVIHRRRELIAYYARRGYLPTGETRPFPHDDERFGLPQVMDLDFVVLQKAL